MLEKEMINGIIDSAASYARIVFEELHKYPELGNREYKTAQMIENNLQAIGLETERPFATSVTAMHKREVITRICDNKAEKDASGHSFHGKRRTVVIRADIDAIAVKEETNLEYKSRNEGIMHACGHDVHTSVLIGVAKVMKELAEYEDLDIDIKYIFQQDEEGSGKGKDMVASGEVSDADIVIGFHVRPELPVGTLGIKRGMVHGASRMFDITVLGKKSHGAMPHLGCDAIMAAANIIMTASAAVPRCISPVKPALISFGTIEGGKARNIISDEVRLSGIIRGESMGICMELADELEMTAAAVAATCGCLVNVNFTDGYPEIRNDDELCDLLCDAVSKNNEQCYQIKNKHLKTLELQDFSLTVDDFAFYTKERKSLYFFLGCGYEDRENSPIHTSTFEADPDCIKTGIEALTAFVLNYSEMHARKKEDCVTMAAV